MRTRGSTLLVAAGLVAWAAGCALPDPGRGRAAVRPPCSHPTRHELGFVHAAGGPWPSFRTTGGEVYVGVRGLDQDTVLGPVRGTRMSLVSAEEEPQFREGTSVLRNAAVSGDLRPPGLARVHVPAGRYLVVSSNYGNLWLETCAEGVVSDVQVAQAATDARER